MDLKERIVELKKQISYQVYEKDEIFSLAMLALLSGESIFLLGKPGIAKSLISRRMKFAILHGSNFEYLMSKFSTPEEIYGPIDLRQLKEGKYSRVIDGYLPTANVGFLDEIWKAGPSIQNTLLTIINEKIFRNAGQDIKVPLKLLISASNELPAEGEGLEALYDRFIIRYIAEPLKEEKNFDDLLDSNSDLDVEVDPRLQFRLDEMELWKQETKKVRLGKETIDFIHYFKNKMYRETNGEGYISDRRWKKIAGLMKSSAYFNGRSETDIPDLFIIPHCIWDDYDQEKKYKQIFNEAFLERIGLELRQQKQEFSAKLDSLYDQVNQIELQLLRITPFENPFKGKLSGIYYYIDYTDGDVNSRVCMISAADWNKVISLPEEQFEVTLYYGSDVQKPYKFAQTEVVKAAKSAQIKIIRTGGSYNIKNENPSEFNRKMNEINQEIHQTELEFQELKKKMQSDAKKYKNMSCIFFEKDYKELIANAFDTKQPSTQEQNKNLEEM